MFVSDLNRSQEVGRAFVQHYYNIFDSNRAGLQLLYQDVSMLTFEVTAHNPQPLVYANALRVENRGKALTGWVDFRARRFRVPWLLHRS